MVRHWTLFEIEHVVLELKLNQARVAICNMQLEDYGRLEMKFQVCKIKIKRQETNYIHTYSTEPDQAEGTVKGVFVWKFEI